MQYCLVLSPGHGTILYLPSPRSCRQKVPHACKLSIKGRLTVVGGAILDVSCLQFFEIPLSDTAVTQNLNVRPQRPGGQVPIKTSSPL